MLSLRNFAVPGMQTLDFDLQKNEVLGLVGLRGAGHEAISRALFGLVPFDGEVTLDGKVPDLSSPQKALHSGVGLVAKDRNEESVAMSLSVRENAFLNPDGIGRKMRDKLLSCEDPTAGVDVGAKSEIYALRNRALGDGVAILIMSTDFEEIATICHRVIVFSQGAIVDELSGTRLTTENLIQSASAGNISTEGSGANAVA